jgi:hypothetical protein
MLLFDCMELEEEYCASNMKWKVKCNKLIKG